MIERGFIKIINFIDRILNFHAMVYLGIAIITLIFGAIYILDNFVENNNMYILYSFLLSLIPTLFIVLAANKLTNR